MNLVKHNYFFYFCEKSIKMAEEKKEKWTQWVALTTTILAVCAAISTLKGGSFSTKSQLTTTKETNKWSYYQSKSIKQNIYQTEADLLEIMLLTANDKAVKDSINKKISYLKSETLRYNKEKSDIKTEAENFSKDIENYKAHSVSFGLASMLLQISIMLCAISALLKKKPSWYLGMVLGAVGILYMINGFTTWF